MLVLSRKTGQQIHIGPDIVISILEIGGKFVRIGVDAPDSVCILRGEVKDQIEAENRRAADQARHLDGLHRIGPLGRGSFIRGGARNDSGSESPGTDRV